MKKNTISRNKAYGVSSKYSFGRWEHIVYGPFKTEEEAQEWLNTEEYDFRERELMSKTAAIRLAGKEDVENAIEPDFYNQMRKFSFDRG